MTWKRIMLGEFLGTLVLVFFGCGVVATAVLAQAQIGLWQVAVVWGLGLSLAIHISAPLSGAHLNPAITLSLWLWRRVCNGRTVALYIVAQFAGAFAGGLIILAIFGQAITRFESITGIVRGDPGSQVSAMMFGEYFPNPGLSGQAQNVFAGLGVWGAFGAELVGTLFLAIAVFYASKGELPTWAQPFFIGAALAIIISVIGPLTQAGLNPARDFGPRLVSFLAGWGSVAIPGPHNGFWIYILGPIAGAILGGGIIELSLGRSPASRSTSASE